MFEHEKNNNPHTNKERDSRDLKGLFLQNRQLSFVVSGVLFIGFFVFMGGYFWGQKNATETFTNKLWQESFSDHIYSSVCSLGDNGATDINEEVETDVEVTTEPDNAAQKNNQEVAANTVAIAQEKNDTAQEADTESVQPQFYAQLVGFGTAHAAQQFMQKLARKDVTVVVKKRTSRTARGRFTTWYQVVSEKFDDKNELMQLVERLTVEEKLKDIQIIAC